MELIQSKECKQNHMKWKVIKWEPVYQAFLLLPLVQEAPANPVRDQPKTHKCKLFILQNSSLV